MRNAETSKKCDFNNFKLRGRRMKKTVLLLCIITMTVLSLFFVTITTAGPSQSNSVEHVHPSTTEYVKDKVLVRFKPEAVKDGMVVPDIAAAIHSKVGATVVEEFKGVSGLQLVNLSDGITVPDAVATYRQAPNVLYAEPDYIRHADVIPNNPLFNLQWGLHNTGQRVNGVIGTPGADIKATEAWDKTTGSRDVIVAVLDTGIDYKEPDLAPNIVNGWDFVTNSSDPMDRDGHGTHVAGIIAAAGNSSIGVTGVMWKAKIMPLRVLDADGYNDVSREIAAIDYADSHGARIINVSFGGEWYTQAEKDAIDASPSLFICAAGNYGQNNEQKPHYPSSYPSNNIIAVAATDQSDAVASFSNYGLNSVQVAAPGANIYSTNPPWTRLFKDRFNDLNAWNSQGWSITNAEHFGRSPSATTSSPDGSIVNTSITLKNPLDLTSKCGTKLMVHTTYNLVPGHDLLYIEASRDGITWDAIDYGSGTSNGWESISHNLTNYDNSPYLNIRFRLTSDGNTSSSSSVYLDRVVITAFDPSSVQQNYVFENGTSMATPYVSGLAGLVKSMYPSYTNFQIKDAILMNVDVMSSLSGKILTGGRINASKTLSGIVSLHTQSFSITSARLVSNQTQHFERDFTAAGIAGARVAPYAMFYKKIATAP